MSRTQFAWQLRLWKFTARDPYCKKKKEDGRRTKEWLSSVPAATLLCTPSAKDTAKHPAHGPEVPKFKPVFKRGAEELHGGLCLRLSRISRDSCRVLKVRTLIYHGFKRVSGGVLC